MGLGQDGSSKKVGKYRIAVGRDLGAPYHTWRIKIYKGTAIEFRSKRLPVPEATKVYNKITKVSELERFLKIQSK